MQAPFGGDLKQWKNVYVTHIVEFNEYPGIALKGTLFLTEHEGRLLIHWVPDPDQDANLPSELKRGYEIDIRDLKHLTCRRLPGFRYRALHLILKNNNTYGPFEFRTGGATEFIQTLGIDAILNRSDTDKTLYYIRPRPPAATSVYQLPSGSNRSRVTNEAGVLTSQTLVKFGASVRRLTKEVSGPMNSLIDSILSPPGGVITGEPIQSGAMGGYGTNQYMEYNRSTAPPDRLRTTEDNDFAVVDVRPSPISLPILPNVRRGDPLSIEQWKSHLDPSGRVTCLDKLRQTIFEGGVDPTLRPLVWKYLLGYYQWDYTSEENEKRRLEKHREYQNLRSFWKEMSHDRLIRFSLFRDRKCYIDKDVPRTDRKTAFFRDDSVGNLRRLYDILMTYCIYNMDFGYFQGMNDLLAVILYVIQQEEDAFWCFVGLMERLESNFDGDLNAVREQFYQLFELVEILDPKFSDFLENKYAKEMPFCFRWLLIQFKREFSYKDVMVLWEAIWSEHLTKNFHIFFAAAVLLMQRQVIMERNYDANSILKHVNDLSYNIPLEEALNQSAAYVKQLDHVIPILPPSVQSVLSGPSLSTSVHVKQKTTNDGSGEDEMRLDYTWGLLNDELEDLMATHDPDTSGDVPQRPPQSVMIPIPSSPSPPEFGVEPMEHKRESVVIQRI